MSQNPPETVIEVASHDLFALAAAWDAESKRLFEEAKNKWHMSDHLDIEHQAKVFRRCSSDLQKLLLPNKEL
jgi:hypothetical protein